MIDRLRRADRALFDAAVGHRTPALDAVFVPAAHTGSAGIPWAGLVLVLRLRAHARAGHVFRDTGAVFAGWAAAQLLKRLNDRTRPCDGRDVAIVDCPDSASMPSDQAATAFAGAVALAVTLPHRRRWAYLAAAVTAWSRVYTGVHYPSDVATGAVVGALVARLLVG